MTSFNPAPPDPTVRVTVVDTVELGWEHTIVDGEIVYTLDDAGQPVPRRVEVPTRVTASRMLQAAQALPEPIAARLSSGQVDVEVAVELVGAIVGRDLVMSIADDQTVGTEQFLAFVTWLVTQWGVVDGGDAGPLETPSRRSRSRSSRPAK